MSECFYKDRDKDLCGREDITLDERADCLESGKCGRYTPMLDATDYGVSLEGRDGPGQPDSVGADAGQADDVDAPDPLDVQVRYPGSACSDCEPEIQSVVVGVARDGRLTDHPICIMVCRSHDEGRCPRPCLVGTYGTLLRGALAGTSAKKILTADAESPWRPGVS